MAKRRSNSQTKSKPSTAKTKKTTDWRTETLTEVRRWIEAADPEISEERKWKKANNPAGVPVWSHGGIVCTGETYKEVVKLTFAKGASLPDPQCLFNSSLEGNTRRAIDLREGESIDAKAFRALIQAAVAENLRSTEPKAKPSAKAAPKKPAPKIGTKKGMKKGTKKKLEKNADGVVLLSGGNPQIAKGEGEGPIKAYIAAVSGWKQEAARNLDELVERAVPGVRKAIKWNSPFYGVEGKGWFLSFHVFTKYLKVVFFAGASLRPNPPVGSKDPKVRYFHIEEGDSIEESPLESWIKQAAALPGWMA